MKVPASRYGNVVPRWMSEAYGLPTADQAMDWLLATICETLGAEACFILRLNSAGTHGAAAWVHGPAAQSMPRDPYPLTGSALENILQSPLPLHAEPAQLASDPWLANRGFTGGAMVALQQGPVRFGSLGVYFTHEEPSTIEAIDLLGEMRVLIWPLLCWGMMGAAAGVEAASAQVASLGNAVHRANNILSNIVLLTDLASSLPCGQDSAEMTQVLQRIASESVRCADVLRELAPS